MSRPRPDTSIVKKCATCKQTKPREEFHIDSKTFDQLQTSCKECGKKRFKAYRLKNLDYFNNKQREYYKRYPEKFRDYELKQHYGAPHGTYTRLLQEQNGCCAICGISETNYKNRFHLDHCHENKTIR